MIPHSPVQQAECILHQRGIDNTVDIAISCQAAQPFESSHEIEQVEIESSVLVLGAAYAASLLGMIF